MDNYLGNPLQMRGVEQYRLQGGKGDGMHFLYVRNGCGLEAWISMDRAGDLSRVSFKGSNMGYFSPCGYVAPTYYDAVGNGFLKSFTAGFFTTCGLTAVGSPCEDEGEALPLHGTVSHIPAELSAIDETAEGVRISMHLTDAVLFGHKLTLERSYDFSYTENRITLTDQVTNQGDCLTPYMILYHCNMGYPLLDESSTVYIPHNSITPRNEHAATRLPLALQMEPPTVGYEECCYYYDVAEKNGLARVGIFNDTIRKGVCMSYNKAQLPCFTQWKMMGQSDYVLGLEPGNCTPDGRDVLRKNRALQFLHPNEAKTTALSFCFTEEKTLLEAI